ncbi:MAG: hypothetical protein JWM99_1680 [Verrucomicrobiales bacterium]|nr:hypothetical protein [Verrucomicrobiales bacterium]
MEIGMNIVLLGDGSAFAVIEHPDHLCRVIDRRNPSRPIEVARLIKVLVQTIVKEIVPIASISIARADKYRMGERLSGIRTPGHFVIRFDVHEYRKKNVPCPIRSYPVWRTFGRQKIVIIGNVKQHRKRPLLQVVSTDNSMCSLFHLGDCRQQQAGKDRNNCDHYQ